jgi:hypothetical protein
MAEAAENPFPVVGIGASAGLRAFLASVDRE